MRTAGSAQSLGPSDWSEQLLYCMGRRNGIREIFEERKFLKCLRGGGFCPRRSDSAAERPNMQLRCATADFFQNPEPRDDKFDK